MMISCDQLKHNQKGIVKTILLDEKKQAKLSHLGLVKGASIQKKFESLFHDPMCYQICFTLFGLRREDAARIEVEV